MAISNVRRVVFGEVVTTRLEMINDGLLLIPRGWTIWGGETAIFIRLNELELEGRQQGSEFENTSEDKLFLSAPCKRTRCISSPTGSVYLKQDETTYLG